MFGWKTLDEGEFMFLCSGDKGPTPPASPALSQGPRSETIVRGYRLGDPGRTGPENATTSKPVSPIPRLAPFLR